MTNLNYRTIFYLILLLAIVIRIYFVFFTNFGWYGCDSTMYLKMGTAILDGNPISYFPNGYPLLTALVSLIFGINTPAVLVIINILVQILTLIIVERILSHFKLDEKVKLISVFLIAFYPDQLSRVRFIMTEPITVFLMMLTIYLFFKRNYYLTGFVSYLTYTFRPALILFAPLVIIYQLYKGNRSDAVRIAMGFGLGILLFVLTDFAGLTAPLGSSTQNLLVAVNSYGYNIDFAMYNFSQTQIAHPLKTYINFALSHPLEYLVQRALVLWSLWGPYVPTELGLFANILHGLRFPFFVGAFITFLLRKRFENQKELILLLFLPVISLTAVHIMFFANQRHTFTAEPFVIMLSVIGLDYFLRLKNRKIT